MTGLLILVGLLVVVVAVMAWRHDRRRRGWTAWSAGRQGGNVRIDNQARGDMWGA